MNLFLIIIIIIIYIIKSHDENSIIRIPNKEGIFKNITTKNGFINYKFYCRNDDEICSMLYITYIIEGIKNINLIKLKDKPLISKFNIQGKNNDTLQLIFFNEERDIYNPLFCEIFYKTKYINKMTYSIGKNEDNQPYKFFGGTPKNLIKNLNKFTFYTNSSKIINIKIEFNVKNSNETKYIINNFDNDFVEFREDEYSLICLPENILYQFKNLFLYNFEECIYNYKIFNSLGTYKIKRKDKNIFPNISFNIDSKIFNLNKENAFWYNYEDESLYFFINKSPCDNIVFGLKFLELFNFREFNLENGEINLYLDKKKNYMVEKGDRKIILNSCIFIIIILSFLLFSFTLTKGKNYYKNKKLEYYNYYYD